MAVRRGPAPLLLESRRRCETEGGAGRLGAGVGNVINLEPMPRVEAKRSRRKRAGRGGFAIRASCARSSRNGPAGVAEGSTTRQLSRILTKRRYCNGFPSLLLLFWIPTTKKLFKVSDDSLRHYIVS